MNQPIPNSFFSDLESTKAVPAPSWYKGRTGYASPMLWYDAIIDDILGNPGTTIKDTAKRLGRNPNTIGLISSSDLFRARFEQRRKDYTDRLHDRLTAKIAQVAEKALDHTITVLDQKRESVPLPLLHEIAKGSLDRLGYAPTNSAAPSTVINNNILNSGTVSPAALERARSHLRQLQINPPSPSPVAGQSAAEGEGED
jgi:hypothetical protein